MGKGTVGRVQGGQGNGRKGVCSSLMSSMEQYPKVRGVANTAPWCECRLNSKPPFCTCETFGGEREGGERRWWTFICKWQKFLIDGAALSCLCLVKVSPIVPEGERGGRRKDYYFLGYIFLLRPSMYITVYTGANRQRIIFTFLYIKNLKIMA